MDGRAFRPLALLLPLFVSGCATSAMKGTPFFTGEYEERQGPAEDRVNLWPLAYYREPALSALWPVGEYVKGEQFAVRPLFSVYNLSEPGRREWNVLWPIAQQDDRTGEGRVFPLLWWGQDYFTLFPLYWHATGPGRMRDLLIPLWWYERAREHERFVTLLGLAGYARDGGRNSWWIAPLAGNLNRSDGSHYRFWLWPIAHDVEEGDRRWSAVFPLWYDGEEDGDWRRMRLALWWDGGNRSGESWRLLLPLFAAADGADHASFYSLLGGWSRTGEERTWLLPLLLSGGRSTPEGRRAVALAGLGYWKREGATRHSHLLPLYGAGTDKEASYFYSLAWSQRERTDGTGWSASPLHYHRHTDDGHLTLSPLYLSGADDSAHRTWSAVVPLYYEATEPDHRTFATLFGGREVWVDGQATTIYPLLSRVADRQGVRDGWFLAPLAHFHQEAGQRSSHVAPLYYRYEAGDERAFISALYARWGDGEDRLSVVPPLLSWRVQDAPRDDWWLLGGLAHLSLGEQRGSSHVLPVYYRNPATGLFLSLLYASRERDGRSLAVIPPLLSWRTEAEPRDDWWLLGGLAHLSLGDQGGSSHVFPVYYRNPAEGLTLSPLFCRWTRPGGEGRFFPPLLSGYASGDDGREFWSLAGLYSHAWQPDGRTSDWLLPLYAWSREEYFYTPLAGWNQEGFRYYLTPLVSSWSNRVEHGFRVFPLYARSHALSGETRTRLLWSVTRSRPGYKRSVFFPLYGYTDFGPPSDPAAPGERKTSGKDFFCIPFCWYRNTAQVGPGADTRRTAFEHGFFPLWSWRRETTPQGSLSERSLLWFLYDRRAERGADTASPHDYVRHRVLWHLWHYERLNGDVSVDALPGITWDARTDGYRKASLLWRVFRWEKSPDGARKLDLLFLPLLRTPPKPG